MNDPVDFLSRFDHEYKPEGGIRPGPEVLTDGDYDFEIESAELAANKEDGTPIVRLGLCVLTGTQQGTTLERASFLSSQENVDRLGFDLLALGIPADTWTAQHGKRFSVEMPRALRLLPGMRFRGKKSSKEGTSKKTGQKQLYHNLWINARLAQDNQPAAPPLPGIRPPTGNGTPANAGADVEEIPF